MLSPKVKREQIERLRLKRGYTRLRAANSEVYKVTGVPGMETPCGSPIELEAAERGPVELVVLGELKVPRNFERFGELHEALMCIVHNFGVEFVLRPSTQARTILKHEEMLAISVRFLKRIGQWDDKKPA